MITTDTNEMTEIINILSEMEDEVLATSLLKEFNDKSKLLGTLILNQDEKLPHGEWKAKCDFAKEDLDQLLEKIRSYR